MEGMLDKLFPKMPVEDRHSSGAEPRRKTPQAVACDICGSPMQEHHCKLVCHACGFVRDCTDP